MGFVECEYESWVRQKLRPRSGRHWSATVCDGLRQKNKLKTTPHSPSLTTASCKKSEPTCIISGGSHLLGALGPPARCKVDQQSTVPRVMSR